MFWTNYNSLFYFKTRRRDSDAWVIVVVEVRARVDVKMREVEAKYCYNTSYYVVTYDI